MSGAGQPEIIKLPPVIVLPPVQPVQPAPPNLSVNGYLRQANGSPAPNVAIQAFDVDLRHRQLLGSSKTGEDGHYSISYASSQLRRPAKGTADLYVVAQGDQPDTPIAQSSINFSSDENAQVDLVVGGADLIGKSEFGALVEAITPALDGVSVGDLVEDSDHQDITYLVGETGVQRSQLLDLVPAYSIGAKIGVEPRFLYGLFREGVSTDLTTLLRSSQPSILGALDSAVADNIIAATDAEISSAADELAKAAVDSASASKADTLPLSKPGVILKTALADPTPIMDALSKASSASAFWTDIKARPETKDKIAPIQFSIQLGAITLNHKPLVDMITQKQTSGEIKSITDLTRYRQTDWLGFLGSPPNVPDEIPGNSTDEKAKIFAASITRLVEDTMPTAFITNRLLDADDKTPFMGDTGKVDVLAFFKNSPNFDIIYNRVADHIASNPSALNGVADKAMLITNVATYQRIYAVAPRHVQVVPLLSDNIQSASQISRMGRMSFLQRYGSALGSSREAEQIYDRAHYTHAMAFTLFANFGAGSAMPPLPIMLSPGHYIHHHPPKEIPDWATLFGSIDSCTCSSCRALDSPAAYLVDLLHFLKDRKQNPSAPASTQGNAKDILLQRRPDLGEIVLCCENTNTPLPYIDLAIEILENAASPPQAFAKFNLPSTAGDILDQAKTDGLMNLFNPPLSQYASVTVVRKGELWKINELTYTYSIVKDQSIVTVQSRTRQTAGTAQELAANPQYVNTSAYDALSRQIYPSNLPYDLSWDTVRTYLNHLGIDRFKLMEAFNTRSDRDAFSDHSIAIEYLGISTGSSYVITGQTTSQVGWQQPGIWNLWGFQKSNLDSASSIADPVDKTKLITTGAWYTVLTSRVDVFLQQSKMQYGDLLNILEVYDVFGFQTAPTISAIAGAAIDTCQLDQLQITTMNDTTLGYIARFYRLKTALNGWSTLDLARAIRIFAAGSAQQPFRVDGPFLVQLAQVVRLRSVLGLDIATVLSFFGDLATIAYVDHMNSDSSVTSKSLFDLIFSNDTVLGQPDLKFVGNTTTIPGVLTNFTSALIAALNISSADLLLLLNDKNVLNSMDVSVSNLSHLYRHVALANAIGISVSDLLLLFKFISPAPFVSPIEALLFVKRAQTFLGSNITLAELDYILRHDFVPGSLIAPDDTAIASILGDLRSLLQRIALDNTLVPDAVDKNGDLLKKKLALLSWDSSVINQFVAILGSSGSFNVQLTAQPAGNVIFPSGSDPNYVIPKDLQSKVNFDPATLILTFRGVMTVDEKTLLLNPQATLPAEVSAQIQLLFDAPRTFLARNVNSFSITDYQTPLSQLPASITIPLNSRVYFDSAAGVLHSKGALTSAERDALISLAQDPSTQQPFISAVNALFGLPASMTPQQSDTFIASNDISSLFDHASNASGNITSVTRFTFVLQKLLPYLLNVLSDQAVTQTLIQNLGLDSQSTNYILDAAAPTSSFLHRSLFRASSFVTSSSKVPATRAVFPDQFRGFELLKKISIFALRLRLTLKQLKWIMGFRAVAGDPTAGWLDLSALPLTFVDDARSTFVAYERLYSLTLLRDNIPEGESTLDLIFSASRVSGATIDSILKPLNDLKLYTAQDLATLVGAAPNGLGAKVPDDFKDEVMLLQLLKCLKIIYTIGCTAADAGSFAQTVDYKASRAAVQSAKSRYDLATWNSVARPLRNLLRERQRAALITYLLANSTLWRDANDLFAYFLIDVEMGPCQLTSRIKQAICSAQLFGQRCLLNLEQAVRADSAIDTVWNEWSWMKYENVHAANYEVLFAPENYMEPELRDDQTDFFVAFRQELQQADITNNTAAAAFSNYLQKLDEISRLQVVSHFREQEDLVETGNPATDIVHIIARTSFQRPVYYYRRWISRSHWDAGWKKMDVDVEGDHIMPVVWNKKLFVFWLTFQRKQDSGEITMPNPTEKVQHPDPYLEINLTWSVLEGDKFTAKKLSPVPMQKYPYDTNSESSLMLNCHVNKDGGELQVQIRTTTYIAVFSFSAVNGVPIVTSIFDSNSVSLTAAASGLVTASTATLSKRVVRLAKSGSTKPPPKQPPPKHPTPRPHPIPKPTPTPKPKPTPHPRHPQLPVPPNTEIFNMSFQETSYSDGTLTLTGPYGNEDILGNTSTSRYNLVFSVHDAKLKTDSALFFQHDLRSFLMVPREVFFSPRHLLEVDSIDPSWMDGRLIGKYFDNLVPQIPQLALPYPDPSEGGPLWSIHAIAKEQGESALALQGGASTATMQLRSFEISAPLVSTNLRTLNLNPATLAVLDQNRLPMSSRTANILQWEFQLNYHPFVKEFIATLNRDGVDGLLQRSSQLLGEIKPTFASDYSPHVKNVEKDKNGNYADEIVDFNDGSYSVYNWELFFHIPLMIAEKLSQNQRFEESQRWFHYIFDPTDASSLNSPQKFWRTKPFYETSKAQYQAETLPGLFQSLAARGDPNVVSKLNRDQLNALSNLENSVDGWREDPFQPFLVARARTTAFQKMVVMKYLDNLIAWGDSLFRGDTIEKINEATQVYVLAAEILGPRPVEIPARVKPVPQSFNTLEPNLDAISNALVQIEDIVPPSRIVSIYRRKPHPTAVRPSVMFFCLPKNDKLLSYWDTVQDRLFKIRHCMNLQGIVRELPLFDPPIDPMLLVKAAASGVDISTALSDIDGPLPYYRFQIVLQRAVDICTEIKALGSSLLGAIEKRDAESIALLRSSNELQINDMIKVSKQKSVDEASSNLDALRQGKDVVQTRFDHYSSLPFMNEWETTSMALESGVLLGLAIEAAALALAGGIFMIPDIKIGSPTTIGATLGGGAFGQAAQAFAGLMRNSNTLVKQTSSMATTLGSYKHRQDDWDLQENLAQKELTQYDSQIAAADVRHAIAKQDLKTHERQITNAKKVDDYMRNKFNNQDLYDWSIGQLSNVYFQSYQLVYDIAKRAERAYCNELGIASSSFVQFGYWDSLKKGLLAGDRLFYDLKRMEMSYQELNVREYEITSSISLAQLDPVSLIQLRENGEAFFTIPEAAFDMAYPGHYMRRIKTVSLTIPSVVGPYTNVNATLSLLKCSVRTSSLLSNAKYGRTGAGDIRFADTYGQLQSIVTSTGHNDAGLFETNLQDERLLPFERCGAISSWRIQLPTALRQFDYRAMTDVIVHMRYTAREGGDELGAAAQAELKASLLSAIALADAQNGLARLVSLRHEPNGLYHFLAQQEQTLDGTTGTAQMTVDLSNARFPFIFKDSQITINRIELFVFVNKAYKGTYNAQTLQFWLTELTEAPSKPTQPATPPAATALAAAVPPATSANPGNPDGPALVLAPWLQGFRTSKDFKKPAGPWQIKAKLADGSKLDSQAIADILFVCYYSTKWDGA